jgi:prevent-host-death family protein
VKRIAAAEFKARCLSLMDDVYRTRQTVVITKRGKPVAKLVPVPAAKDDFIGRLKGKIRIVGDIESPVVPPETWTYSL